MALSKKALEANTRAVFEEVDEYSDAPSASASASASAHQPPAEDAHTPLKKHTLKAGPATLPVLQQTIALLDSLDEADTIALKYQIDHRLNLDLESLDLAAELALQYKQARLLLAETQSANDIPVNQKSQIFNSVRAQLSDIVKQQESVWSMERLKKFEVAFVKAAAMLDLDARHAFFDLYSEYLKDPDLEVKS